MPRRDKPKGRTATKYRQALFGGKYPAPDRKILKELQNPSPEIAGALAETLKTMRPTPGWDWTNNDDYPDPKKQMTPKMWGWEFLRRNPEYLSDWAHGCVDPVRYYLVREEDPAQGPHYEPETVGGERSREFRLSPEYQSTYLRYLKVWDARHWDGPYGTASFLVIAAQLPDYNAKSQSRRGRKPKKPWTDENREDAAKKDFDEALLLVFKNYRELLLR